MPYTIATWPVPWGEAKRRRKTSMSSNNQPSEEERDFYDMKNRACEFYTRNKVPEQIETVLNDMFFDQPDDIYTYLVWTFVNAQISPSPIWVARLGKSGNPGQGSYEDSSSMVVLDRNQLYQHA